MSSLEEKRTKRSRRDHKRHRRSTSEASSSSSSNSGTSARDVRQSDLLQHIKDLTSIVEQHSERLGSFDKLVEPLNKRFDVLEKHIRIIREQPCQYRVLRNKMNEALELITKGCFLVRNEIYDQQNHEETHENLLKITKKE